MADNKAILAVILFCLVLASGCTGLTYQNPFPSWIQIAFIAIIISFFLVSLAYMSGSLFGSPELVMWARNELFQTAAAALMLGMLFMFFSFLDVGFVPAVSKDKYDLHAGPTNIFAAAQGYLMQVYGLLTEEFFSLLYFNVVIGVFQDSLLRVMPMGIGFMINIGPFFTPFAHFVGYALQLLGVAIWAVQLQIAILEFTRQYMFTLFLPLGIVFRSFPFTRSIGGALIAISLGFFVVYPLSFIINMTLYENHYSTHPTTFVEFTSWTLRLSQGDPFEAGGLTNPFNFAWFIVKTAFSTGITALFLPVEIFYHLLGGTSVLEEMFYSVIVFTIILPIVNVFITFTFIREMGILFGADINLGSITRLI